ncbi:hypothetical protein K32_21320 [Kaistia sp. 32K]|uniref:hypothetical protein n=1 Tax=Kaistia sp. 32K TaxID=2795690 RepID=UPI001916349B|nr:hypothetical protein [Kaistia sp. 32K]BCP53515.1 hypothetical protein K32_21320 [Kaistia sp. 32K]
MQALPQRRRIRASARVQATTEVCRASDLLIVMLAALGGVVGLLYLIVTLFPALAA